MKTRMACLKVIGLFGAFLIFLAGSAQAAPIVLRLGNIEAPNNPATIACERMAKLADERSQGRLKIEVFPSSQLGNAITQIEGVMMGSQDMFQGAAEWMGQFEKENNILALAFAFRDQKHSRESFEKCSCADHRSQKSKEDTDEGYYLGRFNTSG